MGIFLIILISVVTVILLLSVRNPAAYYSINSLNVKKACDAVNKISDQKALSTVASKSRCLEARLAAISKIIDQGLLKAIALTNDNPQARLAATVKLTDPDTLVAIACRQGENFEICKAAVEGISDRERIATVAINAYYAGIAQIAVSKTDDQIMLGAIVLDNVNSYAASLALRKITSPNLIFQIIIHNQANAKIKKAAIEMITSQDFIFQAIINKQVDAEIKQVAIEKITEPNLLLYIVNHIEEIFTAYHSGNEVIAIKTANKIDDMKMIEEIAVNHKYTLVREVMVKRINDQTLLAKIAKEDPSSTVRMAALLKLEDRTLFTKIGIEDSKESIRQAVVERLEDQETLKHIFLNDSFWQIKQKALSKITDQRFFVDTIKNPSTIKNSSDNSLLIQLMSEKITDTGMLAELALDNTCDISVRHSAIAKISDLNVLTTIIQHDSDPFVRSAAITNINDQKTLKDIALSDNDLHVKMSAYKKLTNCNNAILRAFEAIYLAPYQKDDVPYYSRKSYAEDLIRLLSKDAFAAQLFWDRAAGISAKAHTDKTFAHQDYGHSSNDCGHNDISPHTDTGIGISFPPYPFND